MSLRAFHVVFIGASTLLSAVFAAWCFGQYRAGAGAGALLAGAAAVLAAAVLAAYGAWFVRTKLGRPA